MSDNPILELESEEGICALCNEAIGCGEQDCRGHVFSEWLEVFEGRGKVAGVRMAAKALRAAQRSTGGMDARVAAPEWLDGYADRLESGEAVGG